MTEHRFDWHDLDYTGIAVVHDYHVDWRILDISGWTTDPEKGGTVIGWWAKGEVSAFPPATDPADAESVVDIGVKWDGCANYSWNEQVATHTCDGGESLAAMILRVHEESARLLSRTASS